MRYLFIVFLFFSLQVFGQSQDFEQTGFEIKAVAMVYESKTLLSYNLEKEALPSRFTLSPVIKEKIYTNAPLIYREAYTYNARNQKDPQITIAPLKRNEVFAFGDDGSISGVKNIAYKPALGGNIFDAYCTAVYASRAQN